MKLVNYKVARSWRSGLLIGDMVVDTIAVGKAANWKKSDVAALRSNKNVVSLEPAKLKQLGKVAKKEMKALKAGKAAFVFDDVQIGPPIPDPDKIICIGLNYHDHAKEVGAQPPKTPIFFAKYRNSLIGPTGDIVPPIDTNKVDYEAELAIVIGKAGRYIDEANAMSHVAGAMPFNDVSARDLQLANQLWTGGKAIDTFGPCGPALTMADEMGDIQNLKIWTIVDGERLQNGNTSSMIFSVAQIIAFLSRIMTLVPGDIIATGTPAGVANAHKPPRFLTAGQCVEVGIEGLGSTRNRVVEAK